MNRLGDDPFATDVNATLSPDSVDMSMPTAPYIDYTTIDNPPLSIPATPVTLPDGNISAPTGGSFLDTLTGMFNVVSPAATNLWNASTAADSAKAYSDLQKQLATTAANNAASDTAFQREMARWNAGITRPAGVAAASAIPAGIMPLAILGIGGFVLLKVLKVF